MTHTTAAVTLADMISRAAYSAVGAVETAIRHVGTAYASTRVLERLAKLDDSRLADIGLSRDDLTHDRLAAAAERRDLAAATVGGRA